MHVFIHPYVSVRMCFALLYETDLQIIFTSYHLSHHIFLLFFFLIIYSNVKSVGKKKRIPSHRKRSILFQ
jgi:hypothetical protein